MKSTLSWVARRSTALIVSPGLVGSSYSMISTLRCEPSFIRRPPRSFTWCTHSWMFGQCVMAAPAASAPVFGATAPNLIGSAPYALPIVSTLVSAADAATFKVVLRFTFRLLCDCVRLAAAASTRRRAFAHDSPREFCGGRQHL